jgi:hypothetical protein
MNYIEIIGCFIAAFAAWNIIKWAVTGYVAHLMLTSDHLKKEKKTFREKLSEKLKEQDEKAN